MDGQKRLLIVDDDKIHRVIYSSIAAKMQYQVDLAESPRAADEALRWKHYDCVILDLMLGEESGSQVLALMSRLATKPRVLLVTGAADDVIKETFEIGRELGLEMFGPVRKPVNVALIRTVLKSMEIAALASEPG
jgi:two-component system chemotaxis response regulator CheY